MAFTSSCIPTDVDKAILLDWWWGKLGGKVLCKCLAQNKLSRNFTNYQGTFAFLVAE